MFFPYGTEREEAKRKRTVQEQTSLIKSFVRLGKFVTKIYLSKEGMEEINNSVRGLFSKDTPSVGWNLYQIGKIRGIEFYYEDEEK